ERVSKPCTTIVDNVADGPTPPPQWPTITFMQAQIPDLRTEAPRTPPPQCTDHFPCGGTVALGHGDHHRSQAHARTTPVRRRRLRDRARGYLMGARCRRPRPTLTRPRPELPLPTAALDSPTARPVTSGGSDGEVRQEAHSRRPGVRVHRRGADGRA